MRLRTPLPGMPSPISTTPNAITPRSRRPFAAAGSGLPRNHLKATFDMMGFPSAPLVRQPLLHLPLRHLSARNVPPRPLVGSTQQFQQTAAGRRTEEIDDNRQQR